MKFKSLYFHLFKLKEISLKKEREKFELDNKIKDYLTRKLK